MPLPQDDDFERQVFTILKSQMFPVHLVIFDRGAGANADPVDEYLLGCFALPRPGDVMDYGETKLGVFSVRHEFLSTRTMPGSQIRMQNIIVGCYLEDS